MLVAELAPTAGTAYVAGRDICTARRDALDLLGFCPQFDALFDLLTGAECIAYFAAINGAPPEHIPALVDAALSALDLKSHANTLTRAYSGGNKRRLSLALAYISAPLFTMVDECSTGVDPFARQRMFKVIQRAAPGRATIMTTHVLEDAEGLCDRIAIMVDGRAACLGSAQHLKAKYGSGYSVEVHLQQESDDAARETDSSRSGAAASAHAAAGTASALSSAATFGGALSGAMAARVAAATALVRSAAPGARLVESSAGHLRFEAAAVSLAAIFRVLESHRAPTGAPVPVPAGMPAQDPESAPLPERSVGVREYSVSQTSLEVCPHCPACQRQFNLSMPPPITVVSPATTAFLCSCRPSFSDLHACKKKRTKSAALRKPVYAPRSAQRVRLNRRVKVGGRRLPRVNPCFAGGLPPYSPYQSAESDIC